MYVSNVTSHCLQQQVETWRNCPERAFRQAYWMRCRYGVPAPTEVVERPIKEFGGMEVFFGLAAFFTAFLGTAFLARNRSSVL